MTWCIVATEDDPLNGTASKVYGPYESETEANLNIQKVADSMFKDYANDNKSTMDITTDQDIIHKIILRLFIDTIKVFNQHDKDAYNQDFYSKVVIRKKIMYTV